VNNGAITFKGEHGVKVMGTGSANLDRVTITGGGATGTGVIKEGAGEMTMTNGSISNVDKGVLMTGAGTMMISGVTISNVAMGVEATAGTLTISGGANITFTSGEKNYGVKVKNGASAIITGAEITGGGQGMGVYGEGAKAVTLERVQISNVSEGVLMKGGGTLTIKEGTTITFTSGEKNYGIGMGSAVTKANITGTRITGGGQGKGVVMQGREMEMSGGEIKNVELGVYVGGAVTNASLTDVNISQVEKGVLIKKGNL
uniref:right-handed parallel beta-helix repeat-containing protein n=1 Tax=Bartonella bovis TaxID=155194 RepID=UPI001304BCEA